MPAQSDRISILFPLWLTSAFKRDLAVDRLGTCQLVYLPNGLLVEIRL